MQKYPEQRNRQAYTIDKNSNVTQRKPAKKEVVQDDIEDMLTDKMRKGN